MPKKAETYAPAIGGPYDGGKLTIPPCIQFETGNVVISVPKVNNQTFDEIGKDTIYYFYLWIWDRKKFQYLKTVKVDSKQQLFNHIREMAKEY